MPQCVYCFGNALHGDDGVGCYIAEALHRCHAPDDVAVLDLGTDGWGLLAGLAACSEAILVDAQRGTGSAGRVIVQSIDEVCRVEPYAGISHSVDLRFALRAAQAELDKLPPIIVVSVTIAEIVQFRISLSPIVARAVPLAVAEIIRLLGRGKFDERD